MNIRQVELLKTAFTTEQLILSGLPHVAFAGRSNVGKSSMLNRLFNRKNLAKVSNTPGKTRSINYYLVDKRIYFVDLPGYGYAKTSQQEQARWKNLLESYFDECTVLKGLVHLIDIRHEPTDLDIMMHEWTQDLVKNHLYVLTKSDKISKGKHSQAIAQAAKELAIEKGMIATFSTENSDGKLRIMKWVESLLH